MKPSLTSAKDSRCHALTRLFLAFVLLLTSHPCWALGDKPYVATSPAHSVFTLARAGRPVPLVVSNDDWPGVLIAARTWTEDVERVTGAKPRVLSSVPSGGPDPDIVIVGTIGHSALIDALVRSGKLDVTGVAGHWEAEVTTVIEAPMPGVRRALVIAGADKRGTVYGLYDLSEQIGVSPWYWWADVPVHKSRDLYVTERRHELREPAVKYRGIFLNDEAPALSGWAREKFGGFNHNFYEHVFELLLRLKANLLWPAMWGSAFNEDDPLNPKMADEYGIVMGTSHHEPMMRAQQEWKREGKGPWDYTLNAAELQRFWREGVRRNKSYEELTTIGMRGDGDEPMSAAANTALLERIVHDQRGILAQEVNPDVTKVPQVWALYKEVQSYYDAGMRVPEDVTLLWSDDNWGNLRRLPTAAERTRSGGAGIYYHFDYVGDPRSYKWLNVTSIAKVQEQMRLAVDYGATREWIVNVGDLKPMEFPIEFFLSMAREPDRWNKDTVDDFTVQWATREFGPEHAREIASIVEDYTRYNARRTPELLTPETYSFTAENEAACVDSAWKALVARALAVNAQLPESAQAAFFELVLFPVHASATVGEMYLAAGRNHIEAAEGRSIANEDASETERLFAQDAALTNQYNHVLLNGKWDHMMDQTHIGYTFWNEPPKNVMPPVQTVHPLDGPRQAVFVDNQPVNGPLRFDSATNEGIPITLSNQGNAPVHFHASASAPWIHLSATDGTYSRDFVLSASIDWSRAPHTDSPASIVVSEDRANAKVTVPVIATYVPLDRERSGFVEHNVVVALDATHATASRPGADGTRWQPLPGYGPVLSGMEAFPTTAQAAADPHTAACLDTSVDILSGGDWTLQTVLSPSLNFQPHVRQRFSVALDDGTFTEAPIWDEGSGGVWSEHIDPAWAQAVSDGVRRVAVPLGQIKPGWHTLHVCRVDPGVVLERFVLYRGASPPPAVKTYLGPRESTFVDHGHPKQRSDAN